MLYFEDLGQRLEHLWRRASYDEEVLADLALELVTRRPPPPHVTPGAIARWLLCRDTLPLQASVEGTFGQPPVTVFRGRRLFIDVYYWLDGTTAIHQHGFAGAFHVLAGSSILGEYAFHETRRVSSAMRLGRLELRGMTLLRTGTTRRIVPHEAGIHSLFHLDRPSVTMVVRNPGTIQNPPPYEYRKPGLALDPFFSDVVTTKALQLLTMLHRIGDPDVAELAGDLVERSDLHTAYLVLRRCRELRGDVSDLLARAAPTHGAETIAHLAAVLEEDARQETLARLRAAVHRPEHRFLLAVLRNAPGRTTALRLIAEQVPGEAPAAVALRLLGEMAPDVGLDAAALGRLRAVLEDGAPASELEASALFAPLVREG